MRTWTVARATEIQHKQYDVSIFQWHVQIYVGNMLQVTKTDSLVCQTYSVLVETILLKIYCIHLFFIVEFSNDFRSEFWRFTPPPPFNSYLFYVKLEISIWYRPANLEIDWLKNLIYKHIPIQWIATSSFILMLSVSFFKHIHDLKTSFNQLSSQTLQSLNEIFLTRPLYNSMFSTR